MDNMFVRNFRGVPQTLQIFKKFYHIQEVKIYTQKHYLFYLYLFMENNHFILF